MRITNKYNLPQTLVRAVERHEHQSADYSASQLSKSPRQIWLERRHFGDIEVDVTDQIWALFGTSVHYVLEQGEGERALAEQYLQEEVIPGVTLSGTSDHYEDGVVSDYKVTSAWSYVFGSRTDDWTLQLNTYAWLYYKAGFTVDKLQIVAIFRDWTKRKAMESDYPPANALVIPITLWPFEFTEHVLQTKIERFERFRDTPDAQLPECTDEERWKRSSKWAVMKEGRKSAVKLYDTEVEAVDRATQEGPNHYVQERPSEAIRCKEYCPVAKWCNQWERENDGLV